MTLAEHSASVAERTFIGLLTENSTKVQTHNDILGQVWLVKCCYFKSIMHMKPKQAPKNFGIKL